MKSKHIVNIIENSVRNIIIQELHQNTPAVSSATSQQDMSMVNKNLSPNSWVQRTPGSPFTNALTGNYGQVEMSNASRGAVRSWLLFAKYCWKKFGEPINWPKQYTDKSVELGQRVDDLIGARQNTANYYRG